MNRKESLAFVGGVIEGEGGFYLTRGTRKYKTKTYHYYSPRIVIINSELSLLDFCQAVIGGKIYKHKDAGDDATFRIVKPTKQLVVCGFANILNLTAKLRPYLITKKESANLLWEFCSRRLAKMPYGERDNAIYKAMKNRGKTQ